MADSARPERSGDPWPHDARETKAHHWATPMQQQPVAFHSGTATSAAALQRYQRELEQYLQHQLSWQLQGSPVLQAMPPSELGWPYSAAASAPFKRPLPLGPLNHLTYQLQAPQPQPQQVQVGQLYLHGSHQNRPAAQPPPLPTAMPPFTSPFTPPFTPPNAPPFTPPRPLFTPGHGAVAGGARLPTRAEGQSSSPPARHRAEESRLQGGSKRVEARQRCEEARQGRCEEARQNRCEEARQGRCEEARNVRCEEARKFRCEEARNVRCEEARNVRCEEARKVRCEEARNVRCEEARMVRCEEGHPPPEAACHDLSAAAAPPSASPASRCGKGVDCPAPAGDLPPTPAQGEARGTPAGIPGPPSAPPPTVHPPAPCSSPAVSPAFARPPTAVSPAVARPPPAVSPAGYRPAVGAVAACAAAAPGVAAGVIFGCNDKTFDECFELCIVGLPNKYMPLVQSIRAGYTLLFLFNFSSRMLHGVYRASSDGGHNLHPAAFTGQTRDVDSLLPEEIEGSPFPAQCCFEITEEMPACPETEFRHVLEYTERQRFRFKLSRWQCADLIRAMAGPQGHLRAVAIVERLRLA